MTAEIVPGYFHPLTASSDWRIVEHLGTAWAGVVVNVADGPGSSRTPDVEYVGQLRRLAERGIRALGYVDLGYGARPEDDIWIDVARWRQAYGISDLFLDRFPVVGEEFTRGLIVSMRAAGAGFIAANPGVHPLRPTPELCDVCVTFEGDWTAYRSLQVPAWIRNISAVRLLHLVYGVPVQHHGAVRRMAAGRGASVYVTELDGANPWRRLSGSLATSMSFQ